MADPLTDKEAAEAFTKEHGFTRNRHGHGRSLVISFGPDDSPQRGKPQCACKVWGQWAYSQCSSVGKTTLADGSTWCGTHAPAAVERRSAAKAERRRIEVERYAARLERVREADRHRLAYPVLVLALREIAAGHNDPRTRALEALALAKEPEE